MSGPSADPRHTARHTALRDWFAYVEDHSFFGSDVPEALNELDGLDPLRQALRAPETVADELAGATRWCEPEQAEAVLRALARKYGIEP